MKQTLFAIGEALIDFIPGEKGCDFSQVQSFSPKVGGAPANVLGAFAKLGGKTQLLTQLGEDPFGYKIQKELAGFGIGLDYLTFTEEANTALAFVSLAKNGDRTFSFYRNPSADMLYAAKNVTDADLKDCYALHFCSVSLGDYPMKEAHRRIIRLAKEEGAIISFDPNLRFPLWKDKEKLKAVVKEFLPLADLIKISEEELSFLTGTQEVEAGCKELLEHASLVICTCGENGAYAYTKKAKAHCMGEKVEAKDTTGAGDAFCGSLLYNLYRNGISREGLGRLSGEELEEFLKASNRYCAQSVQKYGAIESYPDTLATPEQTE